MYNFEILLNSENSDPEDVHSLQDWLQNQQIKSLRVERMSLTPDPEKMGFLDLFLSVSFVSKGSLEKVARSISNWMEKRNSKVKVKIKDSRTGFEIEIIPENLSELEALIDKLLTNID
jgi:Effector Associated Constant Component 1